MTQRWYLTISLFFLTSLNVAAISCDPQKATLELFKRQGLNLLKPARDYIQPGAIVVKRGSNPMEYIDPLPGVPAVAGGDKPFRATILKEAGENTAKFGLAVSMIKSVLPGSLGVGGESDREVRLDQIDASGLRLTDDQLKDLLLKPKNDVEIRDDLAQSLEVFLIQEVYKANSMTVSASNKLAMNVSYDGGGDVVACQLAGNAKPDAAAPSGSKPSTSDTGAASGTKTTTGKAKPDTGAPSGAKPSKPTAGADSGSTKPQADTGAGGGTTKAGDTKSGAAGKLSAAFSVCRAGAYTLEFKNAPGADPIPFAVRLKQVEKDRAGKLVLKRGVVTPSGTLGSGVEQLSFALIDAETPVIPEMKRRTRR